MAKLSAKFLTKNLFIENYQCCAKGVLVEFSVDNAVLGDQYSCSITNVGDSSVIAKPANFKITGIQTSEIFSIALELQNKRNHIIKLRVINDNDASDVAEDLITIECGEPQYVQANFSTKNNPIICNNDPHNLVSELSSLVVGNEYHYSFEPINISESTYLQFLPSSGKFRANNTTQNINTIVKYNGASSTILIKLVVSDPYNDYSTTALATLTCS